MSCAIGERVARQRVQIVAGQRLARRECDRMQQARRARPIRARSESNSAAISSSEATSHGSTGHGPNSAAILATRSLQVVVRVGEGERRAFALARLGDAVGDGAVDSMPVIRILRSVSNPMVIGRS